jgi:serine/threonine protein kinase
MGEVFLIEYQEKQYAMKKIRIKLFEDVEKVMNEIMIGKIIKNNNIVHYEKVMFLEDKIQKEYCVDIIMEFFENGDLFDYLNKRYNEKLYFTQLEVLDYMKQLTLAIKSFHSFNM